MMRKVLGITLAVALAAAGCSSSDDDGGSDGDDAGGLEIEVLSSRPEYVTGGNALVAVTGDDVDGVTVTVGDEDVTDAFEAESDRLVGLIEGLADGDNVVEARRGDDRAEATLVNHSDQGPVFSGEPLELVSCTTDTFGLAASTLEDGCFAPTVVTWEYVDTAGERHPLDDPEAAPADAQTIEVDGEQTPFVIRIETGVLNRSVYRIDKLEGAWNERLVYRFGGGCGTTFSQGFMGTGPASLELLQLGYATATATFNTYQVLCNDVISAETASMVKEHFTEAYGEPAFTIGEGGSGGAIQQILLAQNYPGLLDAIAPSVPFPDAFSISPGVFDCALLGDYYATPEGGQLTDEQRQAVNGHATSGSCELWAQTFAQGIDPAAGCRVDLAAAFAGAGDAAGPGPGGIPAEAIYDAETNPDGLRCTVWETNVAIVGRDPDTGFANSGYDNTGVQYGLDALNAGVLTPAQFLDLNERVGGFDSDGQPQPERSAVDPDMMALAYTTGRVSGPWGGLPDTPIILINVFTDEMGDIHDRVRSFSLLDRLSGGSGDDGEAPATVSLWTLEAGSGGLVETLTGAIGDRATQPTLALDTWLTDAAAYQDDHPDAEWREALAESKPETAESRCFVGEEEHVVAPDDEVCAEAFPISEEPRMAAGGPRSGDVLKCRLVPVDEAEDQYEVDLSTAERDRLAEIFPDGVCDWTQPSVGYQEPDGTWQSFNDDE